MIRTDQVHRPLGRSWRKLKPKQVCPVCKGQKMNSPWNWDAEVCCLVCNGKGYL